VHDLLGRKLFEKHTNNNGNFIEKHNYNLQAGLYLVSVYDGEAKQVKKVESLNK
jgi:hypothetical protein